MTTVTFPYDLHQRVVVYGEQGWEVIGMYIGPDGMRYMVEKDGRPIIVYGEQIHGEDNE